MTDLVNLSLNKPKLVAINKEMSIVDTLVQEFIRVRKGTDEDREAIVLSLCKRTFKSKVIIFCKSKALAHRTTLILGLSGLKAGELHGNLTQAQRLGTQLKTNLPPPLPPRAPSHPWLFSIAMSCLLVF